VPELSAARVALPLALETPLTYRVPIRFESLVRPGVRVLVPLGNRRRVGVVVDRPEAGEGPLREILEVLDPHPLLDEALLSFTRWVSEYYFDPWGRVLQAALPLDLRMAVARRFRLLPAGREALENPFSGLAAAARRVLTRLAAAEAFSEAQLKKFLSKPEWRAMQDLERRGWVEIDQTSRVPARRPREAWWARAPAAPPAPPPRGARQIRVMRRLADAPSSGLSVRDLCAQAGTTPAFVRSLAKRGWIDLLSQGMPSEDRGPQPVASAPLVLTLHQEQALGTLVRAAQEGGYQPFLLEGVTGSGKTEVYLRAAEAMAAAGKQSLYLVPEIGLTPLLAETLRSRFGESFAVLHSSLTQTLRSESIRRIRQGRVTLVLGTRSALFAPLGRLGLIIVDEEQDPSYYQSESPRYHARDAALVRAKGSGALIVLGSATPSLETRMAVRKGKLRHLLLPARIQARELPEVRRVDMREEFRATGKAAILSRELSEAIVALREAGDQGMLLLNRRGYATFFMCRACGLRLSCSSCSIALTYHKDRERLICHYCNRSRPVPAHCPACGSGHLHLGGIGTQRLEEEIRRLDPDLRVQRLDRDVMQGSGHAEILTRFQRRELDLLLGTQMLAKGHDFPGVTLVGVLFADSLLGLPEFRAAERTYQLLAQVAGRAGRGPRPGRVIIQAFDVGHPALEAAATHRPETFYERELRIRRLADYPPWTALLQIRVEDRSAPRAEERARRLAAALRSIARGRFHVLGPAPAPLARLKSLFRQQILLKGARREMAQAVRRVLPGQDGERAPRGIIVEPDPQSLL